MVSKIFEVIISGAEGYPVNLRLNMALFVTDKHRTFAIYPHAHITHILNQHDHGSAQVDFE